MWRGCLRFISAPSNIWSGIIRNDIVRFGIDRKLDGLHLRQAEEPCLGESVSTIHQSAIGGQNDRIGKVGIPNALRVLCHRAAGGNMARPKPAILIQLRDIRNGDRPHGQVAGEAP